MKKQPSQRQFNHVTLLMIWIAFVDKDHLSESDSFDIVKVYSYAILLTLTGVLVFMSLEYMLTIFIDNDYIIHLVSFVIAMMLFMANRFLVAAYWDATPYMMPDGWDRLLRFFRFLPRIFIAVVTSLPLATGLVLKLSEDRILYQLQTDHVNANQHLEDELKADIDNYNKLINNKYNLINKIEKDISNIKNKITDQESKKAKLDDKIFELRTDLNAENWGKKINDGHSGNKGKGDNYNFAKDEIENTEDRRSMMEEKIKATKSELKNKNIELINSTDKLGEIIKAKDDFIKDKREKLKYRDSYREKKDGPLVRLVALWKLGNDPKYGPVVVIASIVMALYYITLEILVLFVKTLFSPRGIYELRREAHLVKEANKVFELMLDLAKKSRVKPKVTRRTSSKING